MTTYKDRVPFSAIIDRPKLQLPDGARMVVWTIVNVENWDCTQAMPRTVLSPPMGNPLVPDLPNWSWHDHNNPTDKPVIWLDCLDAPMIGYYDAMFQEPYPEDVQPVTKPVGYTNASIGKGLMRGIVQDGVRALPLTYKWDEAYHSLIGLDTASRFDGVIMEYANPLTGGHTLPTMALKLQRLRAGEHTDAHSHTSCVIYNVGKGRGYTIIDGKRLDWSQGDTFVLPSMAVHEHGNSADDDDAVLFSMSDLPMIETIGCYREEECDRQEVGGAIG